MLSEIIKRSLTEMNLGIRGHAALAAELGNTVADVLRRDGDACHICGSRIPGYMEIDHLNGHRPCKAGDIRAICQFCHNLRHPLWAGARKRIIPITAPDMTQVDINRLAWVLVAWRGIDDGPIDIDELVELANDRRVDFKKRHGTDSAEVLFEAALTSSSEGMLGVKRAEEIFAHVDQYLRFWPAELTFEYASLDPGSRLSTWDIGGFKVIADEVSSSIRLDQSPDFDKLKIMAEAVTGKKSPAVERPVISPVKSIPVEEDGMASMNEDDFMTAYGMGDE